MKHYAMLSAACLAAVLASLPLPAHAEGTVSQKGIRYTLYEDHAAVSGTGQAGVTHAVIPETIEGLPVTVIEDNVFCQNAPTFLETVSLPETIVSIGDGAFQNCNHLTEINLPDAITHIGEAAFSGCDALTSITLPKQLSVIADDTFSGCELLSSVTFPEALVTIGDDAFWGCTALSEIDLPDSLRYVQYDSFYRTSAMTQAYEDAKASDGLVCIDNAVLQLLPNVAPDLVLPENIVVLSAGSNSSTGSVTSLHLPAGFASLGETGLQGYTGLAAITLDENNTSFTMKDGILYDSGLTILYGAPARSGIASVVIPESVTTIGVSAFDHVSTLQSVQLPSGLQQMGANAFQKSGIGQIVLPDGITALENNVFAHCTALTECTLPATLTSIGAAAFSGCRSLTDISLHEGITHIGSHAWSGCTGLTDITLPGSLEEIPEQAFLNCTSLTSVQMRFGPSHIGYGAFMGCTALKEFYMPNSVTTMENAVFTKSGIETLVLSDNLTSISGGYIETIYEPIWDEDGNMIEPGYTTEEPWSSFTLTPLQKLTFSSNVTNIGEYVFTIPSAVEDIYFYGSEEDWNAIEVERCNESLAGITVHFSAGTEGSGDASWDGTISVLDCVMLQKYLLRGGHVTNKLAADVNQDGRIDSFDLALLKRKLAAS